MKKTIEGLNKDASIYLYKKLLSITSNRKYLKRCREELAIFCENNQTLFLKYMYLYKKKNIRTRYLLQGELCNSLALYLLGINNVNPIEYKISYDTCLRYTSINCLLIKERPIKLIKYINRSQNDFVICKADLSKVSYLDNNLDKFLIRFKEDVQNIEHNKDGLPIIKLNDDNEYLESSIYIGFTSLRNSFYKHENDIFKLLEPKNDYEYVKALLLDLNRLIYESGQMKLFKNGIISLEDMISCRDDIYDYLIKHNIDKNTAFNIMTFVRRGCAFKNNDIEKWNEYKVIMILSNCEDWVIDTLEKIKYLWNRGSMAERYLCIKEMQNEQNRNDR